MNYLIEKYYPYLIAPFLTGVIIYFRNYINGLSNLVNQLCDNGISLSITLVGFFLTILTLVNAIETRRMRFVRDSGNMITLLKYLKQAIYSNVILVGFSFLTKYFTKREGVHCELRGINIWDSIYICFFILTILLSLRFTHIFVSLLADPPRQE